MTSFPVDTRELGEDVPDDSIEAAIMKALKRHSAHPMSSDEIANAQALLVSTFGRDRVMGPSAESARAARDAPFLVVCRKLIAYFGEQRVDRTQYRTTRAHTEAQRQATVVTPTLCKTVLYETMERLMGPIFLMIKTHTAQRGNMFQRIMASSMGASAAAVSRTREIVASMETTTGLVLEGAIGSRTTRLLFMLFEHSDSDRYAVMLIVRISPELEAHVPIGRHPNTPGVDELVITDEKTGGDVNDAIVFDGDYFHRNEPEETPWAYLIGEFVNYVYIDRITCPYDSILQRVDTAPS